MAGPPGRWQGPLSPFWPAFWGILQRPQGCQRLLKILTSPEGVSFPGQPVGLSCRDQAPKSSSSRPVYSWESEQQGGLGEGTSWEGPQESISSRHRACRINFFFPFFPSYL